MKKTIAIPLTDPSSPIHILEILNSICITNKYFLYNLQMLSIVYELNLEVANFVTTAHKLSRADSKWEGKLITKTSYPLYLGKIEGEKTQQR